MGLTTIILAAFVLTCPDETAMINMGSEIGSMDRMRMSMISNGAPALEAQGFMDDRINQSAMQQKCELDRHAKDEKHT